MKISSANMNPVIFKDLTRALPKPCRSRPEKALNPFRSAFETVVPRLVPGPVSWKTRFELYRRREAARSRGKTSGLTLPAVTESLSEKIAFWAIAAAGLATIAYSFGIIATLGANWELFNAWVGRLLN
jgi:hypothetical protein